MANVCNDNDKHYIGAIFLRNPCLGLEEHTKICCVENIDFQLTLESLYEKKVGNCTFSRNKPTGSILFDAYGNISSDVVKAIMPSTVETSTDSTVPIPVTIPFKETTWASSDTEEVFFDIPYGNFDGSPIVGTLTGSVDTGLVNGTDYEIRQTEHCLDGEVTYTTNKLVLLPTNGFANNLTTDAQDLSLTFSYLPRTENSVEIKMSTFTAPTLDVKIVGVNSADYSDIQEWNAKIRILGTISLAKFRDGESEPEAKQFTFNVVEDSVVQLTNLPKSSDCYDNCA